MSLLPKHEAFVAMLAAAPVNNQTPEPKIGPGMILERGRERLVLVERFTRQRWMIIRIIRDRFGPVWREKNPFDAHEETLRVNIVSGAFRVIRPADEPTPQEGK